MNNEDIFDRFNERIEAKKANKPKQHRFDMEFAIGIMAASDEDAAEKGEFVVGILKQFSDVVDVKRAK